MLVSEALFLDNIGKITVFLLLMLVVFLLTVKSHKKLSNYIFAADLFLIAFDLSGLFLGQPIFEIHFLQHLKIASALLQMPLFYLYVLSICYSDFSLQWKQLLHFIPFCIFLFIIHLGLFPDTAFKAYEVVGEVQYLAYIIAIFYALKKHRIVYLENFSNPDYTAYKWLFQATVIFCIAHSLVVARSIMGYIDPGAQWSAGINVLVTISALTVTCWLVMKAMYSPRIFQGVESDLQPIRTEKNLPNSPENHKQVDHVKAFMAEHKPYLDYELSLEKLAHQLSLGEKELSILINQHLGKHFFDFVNEYRIEDAKTLLADPVQSKKTVLEILYQVGFNSKSSFYTAFKKQTGLTPTRYRKSVT